MLLYAITRSNPLAVGDAVIFFLFAAYGEIATAINCLAMTEKKIGKEFLFHFDTTLMTEEKRQFCRRVTAKYALSVITSETQYST